MANHRTSLFLVLLLLLGHAPLGAFASQPGDSAHLATSTPEAESRLGTSSPWVGDLDRIKLLSGEELKVEVRQVSDRFVFYTAPNQRNVEFIDRREVEAIFYRNGQVEKISGRVAANQPRDWQDVIVTYNPSDVVGLTPIGPVDARAYPTSRRHFFELATLRTYAEIILKRKGAQLNADIILVTHQDHDRPYGESPSATLEGTAFRKR